MNIRTSPDTTGAAPRDCAWTAVDDDIYDGADDAGAMAVIGHGATPQAAIEDLLERMEDGPPWQREDARAYRRANGPFGVGA